MKIELNKEIGKKQRVAIPVHTFWAWADLVVDPHVSVCPEWQEFLYLFPSNVAVVGGGIVGKAGRRTVVVVNYNERVVVVEGEKRIWGLHRGKTYVLDDMEDMDVFLYDGLDEGRFETLEEVATP